MFVCMNVYVCICLCSNVCIYSKYKCMYEFLCACMCLCVVAYTLEHYNIVHEYLVEIFTASKYAFYIMKFNTQNVT